MSPTAVVVDATRCPLCGGDNRCAIEIERETGEAHPPCWCMNGSFPPALLERIPQQARGQACICARCMAAAALAAQEQNP
jgi:hypothetical protein